MISFTFGTQRPGYWRSVIWCFVLLAALCCSNGLPHKKTVDMADSLRSASESSTMLDTTEQPETMTVDLGALLDAGDDAIVTLVAGDTRLAAHRAVLAAGSPILAAMFRPDTLSDSGSEVVIPGMEGPVLRQLVAFLYVGRVPQLLDIALQLLAAAEKYGVSALRDSIVQQVAGQLSVENAATTAVLAQRYGLHSLRQSAVALIKDNLEVLATKDWSQAVLKYPVEAVQIIHLITEAPAGTSATTARDSMTTSTAPSTAITATTDIKSTPTATTANPTTEATTSTSTAATPATFTGCNNTPPPNAAAVSFLRHLSAEEKGSRLIEAAKDGLVKEVGELLVAGADVHVTNGWGDTPLDWAAYHGHFEAAQCLLQAGSEVDASDGQRFTPLHDAALAGHPRVVRLLLAANANPNARSVEGKTPLHCAALNGHAVVASALLQAGADLGARDKYGQTALDIARSRNDQQLIRVLTLIQETN